MMKIVYFKDSGKIQRVMDITNQMDMVFYHYSEEYKNNLDYIIDVAPSDIENYVIVDGELVFEKFIPSEPEPNPLETRIKELEQTIDVMLGGIDDGI